MQRHAVVGLAPVNCPTWNIQTSVLRQRSGMEIETANSWRSENTAINEVQGVNVEEDIDVTAPQFRGEGRILYARSRQYRNTQLAGGRPHRHTAAIGLVMLATSEDGSEMMRGLLYQLNCLNTSSFLGDHNNVHVVPHP